jgi:hypothetical protein
MRKDDVKRAFENAIFIAGLIGVWGSLVYIGVRTAFFR